MVSIRAALALALSAFAGRAEPVAPSDMAAYEKGFSAVQRGSRTFHADLRQTLTLQGVNHPVVSLGTLYYQAPDKLLIRFSRPAGEWMLVNGVQFALQKKGQPLQRRDLSAQGKFPSHAASLLDFFRDDASAWHKDFEVTMDRAGDVLAVTLKPYLTPTAPSQGMERVVTKLRLPSYELLEMEITVSGANRIDYQFLRGQRNVPLDPKLFALP